MLIDIEKAKKQFQEYVNSYNSEDKKVKMKIKHIQRVSEISRIIAQKLNLKEEDIKLAELIGLLHDIGRFEQVRLYDTFMDRDSINHAEFGVKILFEDGLIREFIETDKYDQIIKIAILNHNKLDIQQGLTEREYLHAQIIRDADKADIYYVLVTDGKKTVWGQEDLSNDIISDEIYTQFIKDKRIDYKEIKTAADLLVCHFNYVFDLNFNQTKKMIKENEYIDKLYKRFTFKDEETQKRYNKIYKTVKEYVENI